MALHPRAAARLDGKRLGSIEGSGDGRRLTACRCDADGHAGALRPAPARWTGRAPPESHAPARGLPKRPYQETGGASGPSAGHGPRVVTVDLTVG